MSFQIFSFYFLILSAVAFSSAESRKIIIDDDGLGLMHLMVVADEEAEVLGITSVTGNSWSNRVAADNLRMLELIGREDIPVAQGAVYPLVNTEKETVLWESLYGKLTWKGVWMREWIEDTEQALPKHYGPNEPVELSIGNPETEVIPEHAANFMVRMVRKYPGEVTILAAGPLTNLALAQRLDPDFASLAKELIYMGGSFNPKQTLDNQIAAEFAREFKNSPRREFNIRFDPEAAKIVSRSPWKKVTVVPVDPSTSTQVDQELLDRLEKFVPPEMKEIVDNWFTGFPMWDEIASGVWQDPSIVVKSEKLYVDYNTQFSGGYGDTLSWTPGYEPGLGEQLAEVVLEIDPVKLEELLVEKIGKLGE